MTKPEWLVLAAAMIVLAGLVVGVSYNVGQTIISVTIPMINSNGR